MFRSYFKTALRNLVRYRLFTIINILGLGIGLACCMLIFLFAKDEISFDRFHKKKENIYRITTVMTNPEKDHTSLSTGNTGMVQGEAFKNEIPDIEDFVRLRDFTFVLQKGNEVFKEQALYVDDNFFNVFSFSLLQGNPETALKEIHAVILTEEVARKYFGTTDVLGKSISLEVNSGFENFVITGLAETSPENSSIKFGMLVPFAHYIKYHRDEQWLNFYLNTFVVLNPTAKVNDVEDKFAIVFAKHAHEEIAWATKNWGFKDKVTFGLQPLQDIHLNMDFGADNGLVDGSNPFYAYVLIAIALFILLIACINFINLAVAQSLKEAKKLELEK